MADTVEDEEIEVGNKKKTFFRDNRSKRAKDRKWSARMKSDKIYGEILKCSECKCLLEDPVSLKCGHLICKTKCAAGTMEDTWLECSICLTITPLDKDKGIDGLQSFSSVFNTMIENLKSGMDPGLIQEFRILHHELNRKSPVFEPPNESDIKLLPRELDYFKNILMQLERTKVERRPRIFIPKRGPRKMQERFKQLMTNRAAKLIALPEDKREELMAFWAERKVKFPPPPPPEVMQQLHERCIAQAEAIRIENENRPYVPSLLDMEIPKPDSADCKENNQNTTFGSQGPGHGGSHEGPGHGGSHEGRSLLKPVYIYGAHHESWNPETDETTEEEQWVKDGKFDEEEYGLEEDFYKVSEIEHHGNFHDMHMNRTDCSQFNPRNPHEAFRHMRPPPGGRNGHGQFHRHSRPYRGPHRFGGRGPHMGERPRVPSLLSLNADVRPRPPHPRYPMAEHQGGRMRYPNPPFGRDNQVYPMPRGQQEYHAEDHNHDQYQCYPPDQATGQHQPQHQPQHQHLQQPNPALPHLQHQPQPQHQQQPNPVPPHLQQPNPAPPHLQQPNPAPPPYLEPQSFAQQQLSQTAPIDEQPYLCPGQPEPYQPPEPYNPQQYPGDSQGVYHQPYGEQTVAQAQPSQFNQQYEQYYTSQQYDQYYTSQYLYAHPVDNAQENLPHQDMVTEYMNNQEGETATSDLKRSGLEDSGSETGSTEGSSTPTDKVAEWDEGTEPVTTTPHLCVGQLPSGVKPSELKARLNKYGKVTACILASNKSGTKVGYFAMVTMETVEDAAKCIRTLHESRFKGVKITVKKMKHNPAIRRR